MASLRSFTPQELQRVFSPKHWIPEKLNYEVLQTLHICMASNVILLFQKLLVGWQVSKMAAPMCILPHMLFLPCDIHMPPVTVELIICSF